jgi:Secretion system C-terminal sorting domain
MKKFLLIPLLILFYNVSNAQVVYLETFDNISGSTAGGAGTYSFPTNMLTRNVDNLTPNAAVSYVTDSWIRREDFANNVADSCAFSTSWYTPAGISNDWLWTPAIANIPANSELTWNAVTYDAAYPDGYEVRIMTVAPTGGAGVIGNQITSSTVLFSVPAENTTWTAHTVSLSAYAGQTVYIGFRNNSNDKFILLIDDIKVEALTSFDASLISVPSWSEYTIIPENQQPSFTLAAEVDNNGSSPVTGVVLSGEVINSASASVFNSNSAPLASLAAGTSAVLNTANIFTPTAQETYTAFYSVAINESDSNPLNDTLSGGTVTISDTTMARDNGTVSGALGIGAAVTGYLGNQYEITQPAILSSVSMFLNNQSMNSTVGIAIFNIAGGIPTSLIYASPLLVLPTDTTGLLTFEVSPGTPLTLNPGTYLVAAVETDSTLALGTTMSIFTPGTVWVDWIGNPNGTWTNVETFGPNFARTFVVRPNLQPLCTSFPTVTAVATADTVCLGDPVTLTGGGAVTYSWSNNVTNGVAFNPTTTQTYTVTGTDSAGCSSIATIEVVVKTCVGLEDIFGDEILSVYPNPSTGLFQMLVKKDILMNVYSIDGRLVQSQRFYPGSQLLSLENESSGIYIMQIITADGQYRMKLIKQ